MVRDLGDRYQVGWRINLVNRQLNENLKRIAGLTGIDKTLYLHVARHSFGNIAGD